MSDSTEEELVELEIGWVAGVGKGAVTWQVFCAFGSDDIKDKKQIWIPTPASGLDVATSDKRNVLQYIWTRRPQEGLFVYS